jgi:hypothetical protein
MLPSISVSRLFCPLFKTGMNICNETIQKNKSCLCIHVRFTQDFITISFSLTNTNTTHILQLSKNTQNQAKISTFLSLSPASVPFLSLQTPPLWPPFLSWHSNKFWNPWGFDGSLKKRSNYIIFHTPFQWATMPIPFHSIFICYRDRWRMI